MSELKAAADTRPRTMAKPPARKLKVFQAQFGFYDSVVSAPSQAAALKAWGTHQNLFKDGQARAVTDAEAVAAATAHPETPLRRAVGSTDPFELEPRSLPKVADAPKRKAADAPGSSLKTTPLKPPADRRKLDAAEATLAALDEARKAEEAKLRTRREALEAEIAEAQSRYVEHRKSAAAKIADARKVYREAGGRD